MGATVSGIKVPFFPLECNIYLLVSLKNTRTMLQLKSIRVYIYIYIICCGCCIESDLSLHMTGYNILK